MEVTSFARENYDGLGMIKKVEFSDEEIVELKRKLGCSVLIDSLFEGPLKVPVDGQGMERTKDMGHSAIGMAERRGKLFRRCKILQIGPKIDGA